ncbi:MAG: RAMP superfamily CRISPR-associated protein [Chloroflexi bacterium]|nr:RAMP superfamily CRISPR-associated protein [Chloroflexota bacterium]
MLTPLLNEARFSIVLRTVSPVLVRSGLPALGPVETVAVSTIRDGLEQPYLPGSSLRGVLRHRAEMILRTLHPEAACSPLDDRGRLRACGRDIEEAEREARAARRAGLSPSAVYRASCAACRIFGSLAMRGRVLVSDGYLSAGSHPVRLRRISVGVDRFSGASALRSRSDVEAISDAMFEFEVRLQNFEIWQLGLISLIIRDLVTGYLPVGSGAARGLAHVEGEITRVTLRYAQGSAQLVTGALLGVGSLTLPDTGFGFTQNDALPLSRGHAAVPDGMSVQQELAADDLPWEDLARTSASYVTSAYERRVERSERG